MAAPSFARRAGARGHRELVSSLAVPYTKYYMECLRPLVETPENLQGATILVDDHAAGRLDCC